MAAEPGAVGLSELICFDLYAASRAVTAMYRPLLVELDLTYPQYLVLVALWQTPQQRVGQLARSLQLDYGTLTPLLQRLQNKGLITRARRTDDERSVSVGLTDTGAALRQRAQHLPAHVRAATGLDAQQLAQLHDTLQALTAAVTSYNPTTADPAHGRR